MNPTSTSTDETGAIPEPRLQLRLIIVHSPRLEWVGKEIGEGVIGREPSVDCVIEDERLSRQHALVGENCLSLTDLDSRNGTWLSGDRVSGTVGLKAGDVVRVGDTLAVVDTVTRKDSPRVTELTGWSTATARLRHSVALYASHDVVVCITGPTGTGKELVAKAIHRLSGRTGKFVPVNCGAISSSLAQSELFGHKQGAFTGATADRAGAIADAKNGTLFLDELGELPASEQAMLLRVLQDHKVVRVGENEGRSVNFRLVCATNLDLPRSVEEGRFRKDLYHRVSTVPLKTLPLCERRADILELYSKFEGPTLTTEAAQALLLGGWHGNTRELQSVAQRLAIEAPRGKVSVLLLRELGLPASLNEASRPSESPISRAAPTILTATPEAIQKALLQERGNRTAAAKRLGISRANLYRKLKAHGVAD